VGARHDLALDGQAEKKVRLDYLADDNTTLPAESQGTTARVRVFRTDTAASPSRARSKSNGPLSE
jgi:hypothetical protein